MQKDVHFQLDPFHPPVHSSALLLTPFLPLSSLKVRTSFMDPPYRGYYVQKQ